MIERKSYITENKRKKILWIGAISWMQSDNTYFPEATYPGIISGSAFQQAIIEGMEMQGYEIKILSDCDMASGIRLEWSHNNLSKDVRIAGNGNKFLRIPKKIKEFSKELKKEETLKDIDIVLAYEMHIPYLICLYKIKKINPNIKVVLICPDLSLYMDLNNKNKLIKKILKRIEYNIAKRLLKSVDGFILFTEQMKKYFSDFNKPFSIIEGVYLNKHSLSKLKKEKFIMHAGSLQYNVGIEELITAFESLDNEEIELLFFGSGNLDNYIREKAKNNKKIKHMGFLKPKELFEYEKKALVLVNVRNPKEEYTKYSFPSKTFEYMVSGTPFLSTDLLGIPEEYKKYMLVIKNNDIKEIKNGLEYVLALSEKEREKIGEKAQKYILKSKNKIIQSRKVIDFLFKI